MRSIFFVIVCLSIVIPCVAGTIYVDGGAGGADDGSSWADAFTDLQSGLEAAVTGDEIWVAEGTYKPTYNYGLSDGDPNRLKHFRMKNDVGIYGGFPDTGSAVWEDRDPNTYATILSGDLLDNDDPATPVENLLSDPTRADNCYHVFYHPSVTDPEGTDLNTTAVLDGFTITGGNANGYGDHDGGGGMYNKECSPTVSNCTFSGNSARSGGGMCNRATGMIDVGSNPILTNSTFSGNLATRGGGVYNSGNWNLSISCNPILTNCTFSGNSAIYGGGMYNQESSPAVTNCILWGNTASYGNEIALYYYSTIEIDHCDVQGGEVGIHDDGSGNIINWGGGNIDVDPEFVDPNGVDGVIGTTDDDLRLMAGSPCIDSGDNGAASKSTDLDGQGRIMDGDGDGTFTVDMGAYEYIGTVYEPTVIYVDADATAGNNGGSWGDAFTSLQDALDAAIFGDEIRVAEGTYYPSAEVDGSGLRYQTFQMKNEVEMYGGFVGVGAVDPNERNVELYETILSGDIGVQGDYSDNCYNVFYHPPTLFLDATAILDGFTITGGTALEGWQDPRSYGGGGMLNGGCSPTVTNCRFIGNRAGIDGGGAGGGMFNGHSSPTVTGCTFSNNMASGDGGGMFNVSDSRPTVTDCTFSNNSATGSGGGMYNTNSTAILTNCTFSGNSTSGWIQFAGGGGIYNYESNPTVTNCTFSGNSVSGSNQFAGGGGIYNCKSNPTITTCTFSGNSADEGCGGGIYDWGVMFYYDSGPTVVDCAFIGNFAYLQGGGMCNFRSSPAVINCIFSGNSTSGSGGGICNDDDCDPIVISCTFIGNLAGESGGGMRNFDSSSIVSNSILWGNTASSGGNEIALEDSSAIDVGHCDVQGGEAGIYDDGSGNIINWGGGNIDTSPQFIDPNGADGVIGTGDDNLRLMPGSPCIDAGDNGAVPAGVITDFDGRIRIVDGDGDGAVTVDMGAYEAQVIYVDRDAVGANDGTSWTDAFVNLYDAFGVAVWGDEIRVAGGTYLPDTTGFANARDAAFALVNGVAVKGGYAGWGASNPDERDIELYETILSGDLLGNDDPATPVEELLSDPNRADNCYHVFYHPGGGLDPNAVLDGFTITGGNANGGLSYSDYGGGMYNRADSNPTVSNCTFSGHSAAMKGGGMFNVVSSPVVTGCTFIGNSANHGGGMYASSSNMTVTNCVFSTNLSILAGGGMHNMESNSTVSNCSFIGNSAKYGFGGGIFNNSSNLTVSGCTFSDNSSNEGGGGMCNWSSSPTVTDCTFNGNSANWEGGGMNNSYSSSPTMTNCSFSDNSASSGGGMYNDSSSPAIMGCHFVDNSALGDGGGMYNYSSSNATASSCTFSGNSAHRGGGMFNHSSGPNVVDCIFTGNSAYMYGGGMGNSYSSNPTIAGCAFTGNSAGSLGGGMDNFTSSPTITNCILWGNIASSNGNEIFNESSTTVVSYCDIKDSGGSAGWDASLGTDGGGNIDVDPMFVDPNGVDGVIGTVDDDLRLGAGSACIDAGDNGAVMEATDLDGLGRIVDGDCSGTATVDMGAYEFDWLYLGDFAGGCDVVLSDFGVLAESWGADDAGIDIWPYPAGDGVIDLGEFAVLAEHWLEGF